MNNTKNNKNNKKATRINPERRSRRLRGLSARNNGLEDKPLKRFSSHNFYGRLSHSENIIPMITTNDDKSSPLAADLKEQLAKQPSYFSPAKTTVTKFTPNASPLKLITNTDRKREFVRSVKTEITRKKSHLKISLFQTAESASQRKKPVVIKADPQELKETLEMPTAQFYSAEVKITPDILDGADNLKRITSHKTRAVDIANAFKKKGEFEHSHGIARRHGQTPMFPEPVSPMDTNQNDLVTIPAPKEHNSMRLPTIENNVVNDIIQQKGGLTLRNRAELFTDKSGKPIPVLESEISSWSDDHNKLEFQFSPHNGVTPAMEIDSVTKVIYHATFGSHRK